MDVGWTTGAALAVRREVFEALGDAELEDGPLPMFRFNPFRRLASGFHLEEGEDYDFCRRVREVGFKVFADTRLDTVHCKDTGLLRYHQPDWEDQWTQRDASGAPTETVIQNVRALNVSLSPGVVPMELDRGGVKFLVLDHMEARRRETAEIYWCFVPTSKRR